MVVADEDVLGVPGSGPHGSTVAGNPLACAVAGDVLRLLEDGSLAERASQLGRAAAERLGRSASAATEIRQIGLWIGIDIDRRAGSAREICERLPEFGVLCKDTHEQTVRFAPPLIVKEVELDWALSRLEAALVLRPMRGGARCSGARNLGQRRLPVSRSS